MVEPNNIKNDTCVSALCNGITNITLSNVSKIRLINGLQYESDSEFYKKIKELNAPYDGQSESQRKHM